MHDLPNNGDNSNDPRASILLLICGYFSNKLSLISYQTWKSETFYWLSVISVTLIIIVNLPKAFKVVRNIFKK